MTEHLHVVATAGHVDHGKSSLIRALTGIEPDRLQEERRRGLTIDLGYAWTRLPSGREVGFVDVPGHERFVKNMLAGVGPVRLVLFVVAADEGWKPQSEEHLQIVDVLGAERAVFAVTKTDLTSRDDVAARAREISGRLAGTGLEGSPVVGCSAATNDGVDAVARALDAMVAAAPAAEGDGRARLFVDRVFTIRGSGTVVTGTLTGGALRVDEAVVLMPSGIRGRVRALQTHGRSIQRAVPVSRVAVNLSGITTENVRRGDALVHPGRWRATRAFEGTLRAVRGLPEPLTTRGAFKVHAGSAERDARIRLLGAGSLSAGEETFVRVVLTEPLALDPGEPFVLREAGRRATVGGGRVLDPHPPTRPGADAWARLGARRVPRHGLPEALLAERGAVRVTDVLPLTGVDPSGIPGAERLGDWWVHRETLETLQGAVLRALRGHHAQRPLSPGLALDAVRSAVADAAPGVGTALASGLGDAVLDRMTDGGQIERAGTIVREAGYRLTLGEREPEARRIEEALAAGWPAPPTASDLGADVEVLRAMADTGRAVEVARGLFVLPEQLRLAEAAVRELASVPDGMTASAFRERLGTSRKYAIPLLEWFDTRGLTRRAGDVRHLREPPRSATGPAGAGPDGGAGAASHQDPPAPAR